MYIKTVIVTPEIIKYVAKDGKEFDSQSACMAHEEELDGNHKTYALCWEDKLVSTLDYPINTSFGGDVMMHQTLGQDDYPVLDVTHADIQYDEKFLQAVRSHLLFELFGERV